MTYKARVEEFWVWFEANAERFLKAIDDEKCGDLTEETSEAVKRLGLVAWVYGPPAEGKSGHSLTVSGEGNIHEQYLTEYWLSKAPKIEGWTFYSARQPGSLGGRIDIKELQVEFQAIWVSTEINNENENIDITIWHHNFNELEENDRFTITFIVLDAALGEYGTGNWIGEINFAEEAAKDSMPIAELKDFVDELEEETGWKKYPPTDVYSTYEISELEKDFPRSDTFIGTTSNFNLVRDFLNNNGVIDSPIAGTGADFIYVSGDREILPEGGEVDFRADIEDALSEALEPEGYGKVFGGASGRVNFYIDIAIFDGDKSIEIIKSVLRSRNLPKSTVIRYFEKDRGVLEI